MDYHNYQTTSQEANHSALPVERTPSVGMPLKDEVYGWLPEYDCSGKENTDCVLCSASEDVHARAWEAYGTTKNSQAAVRVLRRSGLSGIADKEVASHFQAHHYEQPAAPQASDKKMLQAAAAIPDRYGRANKIIQALSRQGALSYQQIVQLFCEPDTNSEASANKTASRLLSKMRFAHQVYPIRAEGRRSAETYYTLAPWAVPGLERMGENRSAYTPQSFRDQKAIYQVEHDVAAADVFVQLRRQLYPKNKTGRLIELFGSKVPLHMSTDSWWGHHSLLMSSSDGKLKSQPDGFATLEINDGRRQQFQLPMFMEWDGGMHSEQAVAQSMADYARLAASGKVGERFPQLNVPGYQVPMLLVCPTENRAQRVVQQVDSLLQDLPQHVMLLITDQEKMQNAAWEVGSWTMVGFDASDFNLVELLMTAARKLNQAAPIHWRSKLKIDLQGARLPEPRYPNWMKETVTSF